LPFFFLALAIIVAFHVVANVSAFLEVIWWVWGVLAPFFYGFLIAYILNIPASAFQRLFEQAKVPWVVRRGRTLGVVLVFLLLLIFVAVVLILVIPAIVSSVALFASNFQAYYENALGWVAQLNSLDIFGLYIDIDALSASIWDWFQNVGEDGFFMNSIHTLIGFSTAIFGGLFTFFLALVSAIYMLLWKDAFKGYLARVLRVAMSPRFYRGTLKYSESLNDNFKRYIYTQTIDGLILGTMATIQLWIIGSPFALLLGIMLGIVNYIPYFGSIFGTIVAVLVVAFTEGIWPIAVIATVTLFITQQIDANIIQPRLMSGSFKMSPLLVIIAITIGGAIAGILGMIAAIPIAGVIKDMVETVLDYYEHQRLQESGGIEPDDTDETKLG